MKFVKKTLALLKKCVPVSAAVFFALGALSVLLYAAFSASSDFADAFNGTVSASLRFCMAKLTAPFPFSVAEAFVFTSPVTVFLVLRAAFAYMDTHEYGFVRAIVTLLSVGSLLFSVFTLNFAAGYRTPTLDEKLGIEVGDVSRDELRDTAYLVTERLNLLADEVTFTDGGSVRGSTHAQTVDAALDSYEKLSRKYGFLSNFSAPVKRLAVSPIMTYTHISGIYTFFTGEANINTNYPEFVNVFTTAHEMAHQRGVARENEANFTAYLVCITSDDAYLQYSGYLNMLEYLLSALSSAGEGDTVKLIYAGLDPRIYNELVTYSRFFEKYDDSVASDVVGTVNDAYLQSQGTAGVRSYGMVVDLAVAYHRSGT